MQNHTQAKIENMAARILRGWQGWHEYTVGEEVEWLGPGASNASETIQRREPATQQEIAAAESLAKEWVRR